MRAPQTKAGPRFNEKEDIMKIPQYITVEEVRRVCGELKISDWTAMEKTAVPLKEARVILKLVNTEGMDIDPDEFRNGLEVELEHGMTFKDANVTNNHPILTGLIVLAHFKESLDYYRLLEVAELEGDLLKATVRGDATKIREYYKRLAKARITLHQAELDRLG
jgi:hypothetical protein